MKLGLRIDVDTYRGTQIGVPNLLRLLDDRGIKATFFFSVGPDNMGRHLWRLLRPQFLLKMLRTRAASLYGPEILLRGTFGTGPLIGKKFCDLMKATVVAGHEAGLHEWDHYTWQTHLERMDRDTIHATLKKGVDTLTSILGTTPVCSAVPAWKCNDTVLLEKNRFPFRYNSDCRGKNIFRPMVDGQSLDQLQIPVTLPTYDETVGRGGITNENFNHFMIEQLDLTGLNVLTIHAEAEGIACLGLFERFIEEVQSLGGSFCPLGELIEHGDPMPRATVSRGVLPGREGWLSVQTLYE